MSKDLLKTKWEKFEKRAKFFRYIPFVDFVLASGSMAMGTARPDSDFDVIVGIKHGRIFTARFLAVLLFGLRGWRAIHPSSASWRTTEGMGKLWKDKICLNHFVTAKSYRLSPPYNHYWQALYSSLVPLFGNEEKIKQFFAENSIWMGGSVTADLSRLDRNNSSVSRFLAFFLKGSFGNWIERMLKEAQIARIKRRAIEAGYKPRLVFSDSELEFHPHTLRIDEFCERSLEREYASQSSQKES